MTTQSSQFPGIHFVGSLPFENGEQAFKWIGEELRPWVRRVPDETGHRASWISTQIPVFFDNPAFESIPGPAGLNTRGTARLKDSIDPATLKLGPLRYASDAKSSYRLFSEAKASGVLPASVKFQFGMPSPVGPFGYVSEESRAKVYPAYEAATKESVDEILASIPHNDLVIQWDLVQELAAWEGHANLFGSKQATLDAVLRISRWIPEDVEMGFHLCEGDRNRSVLPGVAMRAGLSSNPSRPGDDPATGPADATGITEFTNDLSAALPRSMQYIHLPTWVEWKEPRHFEPLRNLKLRPETELYIGLVHPQDGTDGGRQRRRIISGIVNRPFGISTPCGMGRYGSEEKFRSCATALRALAEEA